MIQNNAADIVKYYFETLFKRQIYEIKYCTQSADVAPILNLLKNRSYFTSESTLRPCSGLYRVRWHRCYCESSFIGGGNRSARRKPPSAVGEDENTTAMAGDRTSTSGLTVQVTYHWTTLRPDYRKITVGYRNITMRYRKKFENIAKFA